MCDRFLLKFYRYCALKGETLDDLRRICYPFVMKYLPVSGPEQFRITADVLKELLYEVAGIQY